MEYRVIILSRRHAVMISGEEISGKAVFLRLPRCEVMVMPKISGQGTGSIQKCLAVLDCFNEEVKSLSLTQVSNITGFPMPTALRILSALQSDGYVTRDENRNYSIGWKLYRLGQLFNQRDFIKNTARPIMNRLRDETGESVSLYLRHGIRRVCVEQAESRHEIKRISRPGVPYPLWGGATAKIFLGHMSAEDVAAVFDEAPENRKAVWDDFLAEVAHAKRNGYSMSRGEREEGAASVAAPVFGFNGELTGAISVSGPCFRLTPEKQREIVPFVVAACREISSSQR